MNRDQQAAALLDRIKRKVKEPKVRTNVSQNIEVTAGELRNASLANPTHPNAEVFLTAVSGDDDDAEVVVEETDLIALLENRTVSRVKIGPNRWTKTLGDVRMIGHSVKETDLIDEDDPAPAPVAELSEDAADLAADETDTDDAGSGSD